METKSPLLFKPFVPTPYPVQRLYPSNAQYGYNWSPPAQSNETTNGYFLERSQTARITLATAYELCPEEEAEDPEEDDSSTRPKPPLQQDPSPTTKNPGSPRFAPPKTEDSNLPRLAPIETFCQNSPRPPKQEDPNSPQVTDTEEASFEVGDHKSNDLDERLRKIIQERTGSVTLDFIQCGKEPQRHIVHTSESQKGNDTSELQKANDTSELQKGKDTSESQKKNDTSESQMNAIWPKEELHAESQKGNEEFIFKYDDLEKELRDIRHKDIIARHKAKQKSKEEQ